MSLETVLFVGCNIQVNAGKQMWGLYIKTGSEWGQLDAEKYIEVICILSIYLP